jgi:hypothetical protein
VDVVVERLDRLGRVGTGVTTAGCGVVDGAATSDIAASSDLDRGVGISDGGVASWSTNAGRPELPTEGKSSCMVKSMGRGRVIDIGRDGREMLCFMGDACGESCGEEPALLGRRDSGDDTMGLLGRVPADDEADTELARRMGDRGGRATGDFKAILEDALERVLSSKVDVAPD